MERGLKSVAVLREERKASKFGKPSFNLDTPGRRDCMQAILDGHIVLTRRLAHQKHFPAIDVLESVSRVRDEVISRERGEASNQFLRLEAAYRANEDLISVGAYKAGADPAVDTAIAMRPQMLSFLRQQADESTTFEESHEWLGEHARVTQQAMNRPAGGDA